MTVGHWTDFEHRTGCTVILLPEGTIASGEVSGGAPATREFALLDPTKMMNRVDAVVLAGGSAFGLAACEGVMDYCAEHDRGFDTKGGKVPIVVGMCLYDLTEGRAEGAPFVLPGAQRASWPRSTRKLTCALLVVWAPALVRH